ncbi:hypothetical protein TREMEDRAFT_62837 [Tremella mesenterica DSM 1558]|uniref:uncharacterized protein n=1 Tax=Tremella mesenterica (strain ATCC 24925 / CBS 8224 / DSM 1558 / NBRC 9311 / NRRL Y-6157 / RJB 2259-6 / UBC 559-6) TaxID=578456 RepID=UPI0003F4923E|nr:uncharacterized protein TREMEDRAFT_62837 [Tremella mesenterica DSM 1558]EIW69111.1 hypothetical protein TREMEDRAFT_62837 [Tremella mesenterica DSM 1558]
MVRGGTSHPNPLEKQREGEGREEKGDEIGPGGELGGGPIWEYPFPGLRGGFESIEGKRLGKVTVICPELGGRMNESETLPILTIRADYKGECHAAADRWCIPDHGPCTMFKELSKWLDWET